VLEHYEAISSDFEQRWFFDAEYFPNLCGEIAKALEFDGDQSFCDLGCGTGHYTAAIEELASGSTQVTGVDFSSQMIDQFNKSNPNFKGLCADIEKYVGQSQQFFDRVLLKEVIHHIHDSLVFFSHINSILNSDGLVLIVTRPRNVNFPFFKRALDIFAEGQPAREEIKEQMIKAGFSVELKEVPITIKIEKQRLLNMIRQRFMSIFHSFSEKELELGIQEVEEKYKTVQEIEFDDVLLFIKGRK
jgi:SAM-dependent methyltransferase